MLFFSVKVVRHKKRIYVCGKSEPWDLAPRVPDPSRKPAVLKPCPPRKIRGWSFNVVDDEHLRRGVKQVECQTDLLLQSGG